MKNNLVKNLRLRPSILTLFVLLTVPVFFAIVAVTYFSNEKIARSNADQLVERFRTDAIANIQNDFDPIKSLVRSAAAVGADQPDFYSDNRSLRYLFSIIQHSDKIVSMYVGLADGSFRQARQIEPTVEVQGRLPPPDARYADRWIDAVPRGTAPIDHYLFLDAQRKEVGKSEQVTAYDPRARLWYRMTQQAGTPVITDPDVFAALGLIGFTVAAPIFHDGKMLGVAAADITLDGLSEYLVERKISPGTLSYILDHQGRVIANSERIKTYTNYNGRVELQHITSLGNDLPAIAFSARPRDSEKLFSFTHAGKDYVASLTTLPADFGKRWQLFVVTPLDDFTEAFQEHNKRLFLFGVVAIVLQVCIIYFLSSVISAPLEKLAHKVIRIQDLEGESLPPLESPIREVAVLSRAIDTLDAAVKSFAAFVPVGLVKQLLESDQKLELGGHSRFLTIFFSDLEAFSSLSEEVPSQELLLRVSAYLAVVTKAVNEEAGTIDKFIGDGVMAFWGAPALLDDHAARACFAALRIRRGMEGLNAQWQADGLKPLNIRIGIHSDAVLVGNIGSKERMSYTVMGDGVNVAARLEGINKEYGTRICISHSVFKEAGDRLCVRPIDDVAVKGRRAMIPIYEVMGGYGLGSEFEPDAATVRLCKLTRTAYEALVAQDNALALDRYRAILAEYPGDPVASEMARRLAAVASTDGVRRGPLARL
ncbi:MAG: adenylate/guanylate cyclase domain-containing protein [Reyranella sp.]|uniref:adenylate/guanylate cyclase domain-containing protein n=1 Tax=Reyranella sp. TaxID=1929291 RepID=UPI0012153EA5|nr:adenylate/guanylate cyclase domain-containing protein [Reyranella sp.]TAJ40078.1 MAG: adenylate/guanylate cyclase domain-containing protein [Reyranella sp.]